MGNFVIRVGGITSFFFLIREKQRLTGRLISKADRQVTGAIGNWDSSPRGTKTTERKENVQKNKKKATRNKCNETDIGSVLHSVISVKSGTEP